MLQKFKAFFRSNKRLFLALLLGLLSLLVYKLVKDAVTLTEVFGWLRLWKYLSLILILVCLYSLFLKGKRVVFANLTLIVLLLFLVETTLFFVLGMPPAYMKDFSVPDFPEDHMVRQVGAFYWPDSIYRDVKVTGNDTVFDVHYTIDHFNKRTTPGYDSSKTDYALFFGCSIGFGYGLEDNQTLAYQVQQQSSNTNAYNFCISATGTNHMLALLQYRDLSEQVAEKNGCAYYIFFWDHLYRSIGTMHRYTEWLNTAPYYEMQQKKLVRNKSFKDGRPFISGWYERLYQTNIVKYFKTDLPLKLNESHFDLVTEMVLESKKAYEKQFGNDRFYLVFYPSYVAYTPDEMRIFKAYLTRKKIKFIDLSNEIVYQGKYTLAGDGHPNAETNKLLANLLLQKKKKQHLK